VEGGDERRADPGRQDEILHPAPHLAGRLVGEGHREHVARVDALDAEEPRDPVSDDARLAAAGAGQHQHRALDRLHRLPLHGIERSEHSLRIDGGPQHG